MPASAPHASSNRWLFGPIPDLLLGCGLLYMAIVGAYAVLGSELRAAQPNYLMRLLVIAISMPHYGGTLLRVYEQRSERRSYALFSVGATLLVLAAFIASLYSFYVGSLMLTLYLTWSPWHYTGQNYGIAVMFARRRGVELTPLAKRLLYASFMLSFVLTALVMHSLVTEQFSPFSYSGDQILFLPLGLPAAFSAVAVPLVGAAYLACLVGASALLLRGATLRDLAPVWALAITQALWFAIPYAVLHAGVATGIEPLDGRLRDLRDYSIWVVLGHAAQYLWITTFYARGSAHWSGYANYLGKASLTGVAIWTLPVILFAPDVLGRMSHDAGLAMVVASAVNLHHFILDGAIWKLRHMKIASVLIRTAPAEFSGGAVLRAEPASEGGWLRRGVWAVCSVGFLTAIAAFWLSDVAYHRATRSGDVRQASQILDRLAWIGRDNATRRLSLAQLAARQGLPMLALAELDRSIALNPRNPKAQRLRRLALERRAGS